MAGMPAQRLSRRPIGWWSEVQIEEKKARDAQHNDNQVYDSMATLSIRDTQHNSIECHYLSAGNNLPPFTPYEKQ